ncbi:hypothetical protein KEM54_000538, partial [Ascosphaera aggregata]
PDVGVGVGYHLRNGGSGTVEGTAGNAVSTSITSVPQPSSSSDPTTSSASAGNAGTVLPHIQLPAQNNGNGSQYYDPFMQHQHHIRPSFTERKRTRDDRTVNATSMPAGLDVADVEPYISRNNNRSQSGDTPSLLQSTTNSGPTPSTGRTPPPSSRQSTPLPLSPYNFPYPYHSSLTPGISLMNPPGPGSTSSANMATSSSGNLNMGNLLNLSPLVGYRKDASISPGPGLVSSASAGVPTGVNGHSNPGPTSVPVKFSDGNDDGYAGGEIREGKRRYGMNKRGDTTAGKDTTIKFPLDYQHSLPQIATEQDYQALIANITAADDINGLSFLPETFHPIPHRDVINTYLASYFTHYHPHLPFLHVPTFTSTLLATPPALLLAVLSLGALVNHSHEAFVLHIASKALISRFLGQRTDFDSRLCPLWAMQSILLNMIFGSWSGGAKGLEWTCSIKSLLANLVSGSRYALRGRIDGREKLRNTEGKGMKNGRRVPDWEEWIDEESCRRTYFAVFVFFGLLTLVFNHPNSMSGDELDGLELPCEEEVWAAPREVVEKYWSELASASDCPRCDGLSGDNWNDSKELNEAGESFLHPPTVRTAHDSLFRGDQIRYSVFATRIMVNVLFYEVWNHRRTIVALQDVVTEFKLRLALDSWESSYRNQLFREDDKYHEREKLLSTTEPGVRVVPSHPLLDNSLAIYRIARIRLTVDLKPLQEALRYHSPYEIAASMTVARDLVKRDTTARMEGAVRECCEGIEEIIRMFGRTCSSLSTRHKLASTCQSRRVSAGTGLSSSSMSSASATPAPPATGVPNTSTTTYSCGLTPACQTPHPLHLLSSGMKSSWGVEHSLCLIDMLVILTLWLYRLENAGQTVLLPATTGSGVTEVEPEPEASEVEVSLYQRVRNLFGTVDEDVGRARTPAELSAGIARVWGDILDPEEPAILCDESVKSETATQCGTTTAADPTIWRIEKVIGESFKLHSQALIGYRDDMSYISATTTTLPVSPLPRVKGDEGTASAPAFTDNQSICTGLGCSAANMIPARPSTSTLPPLSTQMTAPAESAKPGGGGVSASGSTTDQRNGIEHMRGARGLPSVGTAY